MSRAASGPRVSSKFPRKDVERPSPPFWLSLHPHYPLLHPTTTTLHPVSSPSTAFIHSHTLSENPESSRRVPYPLNRSVPPPPLPLIPTILGVQRPFPPRPTWTRRCTGSSFSRSCQRSPRKSSTTLVRGQIDSNDRPRALLANASPDDPTSTSHFLSHQRQGPRRVCHLAPQPV
jgi:hypothetical protein